MKTLLKHGGGIGELGICELLKKKELVENRWAPPTIHIHKCIYFIMSSPGKPCTSAFTLSLYSVKLSSPKPSVKNCVAAKFEEKYVKAFTSHFCLDFSSTEAPVISEI